MVRSEERGRDSTIEGLLLPLQIPLQLTKGISNIQLNPRIRRSDQNRDLEAPRIWCWNCSKLEGKPERWNLLLRLNESLFVFSLRRNLDYSCIVIVSTFSWREVGSDDREERFRNSPALNSPLKTIFPSSFLILSLFIHNHESSRSQFFCRLEAQDQGHREGNERGMRGEILSLFFLKKCLLTIFPDLDFIAHSTFPLTFVSSCHLTMAPPYPQKLHFQSLLPGSTLSPFDVSPTLNLASPIVNRLEAKDQTYQLMFRSRGIARKDRRRLRRFERKGSKRKLFSWIGWPLDFEFRHLKRSNYPLISRPIGFEVSDTESRQQAHEYTQVTSKREEKKRKRSFLKRELSL